MEAVFEGPGEYDAPTVLVWPVLVDGIYTGGHQEAILYPNGRVEVVENTSYDSEQQWLQAVWPGVVKAVAEANARIAEFENKKRERVA